MHILVLGGTRFVGRAVVDAALDAGHDVSLFNRGRSNPGLYPGIETLIGDRETDLSALRGRSFDVVVDCAGYHPDVVRLSAEALRDSVGRYVFVSSASVYADQSVPPVEGAALLGDDSYGGRKAACERVVVEVFGERALIARPGLITGPYDPTERVAYWPRRFARGGRVLAPGDPGAPAQFIDVRDLGRWLVGATATGVFNAVGPTVPMAELLEACRAAAGGLLEAGGAADGGLLEAGGAADGGPAELVWVPSEVLLAAGADPWMGVPLWIADPEWAAANRVDGTRAWQAGLVNRPVAATVADLYAWDLGRGGPSAEPLSPDEEERLLRAGPVAQAGSGAQGRSASS
jgi:2'-hydroxyisoflavone reductase